MWELKHTVERLMKDYPYGCQSGKESKDIIIPVKLSDIWGTICWWLAEYDPEENVAFGYVTGFSEEEEEEFGAVYLEEIIHLEELEDMGMNIDLFRNRWTS
jgi:hypothetical protein